MSDKKSFILRKIDLRKSPGLPRGLKTIGDLSPKINIVYGPNGSGKTSLARAIHQVIWQETKRGVELEINAEIGDDTWKFHIDNQPILTQKNGLDAHLFDVPPQEMKKHYALSIADLFIDDDADLAREIRKQASGGYDLDKAGKKLKYSSNMYSTAIKEYKDHETARNEVRKIQNEQRQFKEQERSLESLSIEEQAAKQARSKMDFLKTVVLYLEKLGEVIRLEKDLNQFHEIIGLLRGDELDRIQDLEQSISEDQDKLNSIEQLIAKHNKALTQLEIPSESISPEILDNLQQRLDQLHEFESEIVNLEREIVELERTKFERLKAIDQNIDPEVWKGINMESTTDLDRILMDAHKSFALQYSISTRLLQLEEEMKQSDQPAADIDQLRKALHALSEWLKVEPIHRNYSTISLFVMGGALILLGFLAIQQRDMSGYSVFIFMLPVFVLGFYFYKNYSSKNEQLKVRERDFETTGIEKPVEWNTKQVQLLIEKLVSDILSSQDLTKNEKKRRELQSSLIRNKQSIDELQTKIRRFKLLYQTIPDLPDFDKENYNTFYWFIKQAEDWQNANTQYVATKERQGEVTKQFTAELGRINKLLQENCKADIVKDYTEAKSIFRKIKDEENTREQTLTKLDGENKQLVQTKNQIERNTGKLRRIYQDIGLTGQDKTQLKNYMTELDQYNKIKNDYSHANSVLDERLSHVRTHSLYESHKNEMDSFHIDELKTEVGDLGVVAASYESIRDNVTRIETEVDARKRENTLERALNTNEGTKIALEQKYNENLNLIAGDIILLELQSFDRASNQPQVVTRANGILGKITSYRYELISGDGQNDTFIVKDTTTGIGQTLDQLSSGTRVQLLLAVKIAYLELQEGSLKFPILADELLANSDDIRSPDIIMALIELSKEDRQIFYFTAQRDEQRLWEQYLQNGDISYKSYTLGEGNEKSMKKTGVELREIPLKLNKVPDPDGLDYETYGRLIHTDFDIIEDKAGQLPLYFLMDNLSDLHPLLIRNITNWEQLKLYHQFGGKLDKILPEHMDVMEEKICILEKYQMLYRIGRSKRIDRSVLEDSGAISDVHMESVMKLLIQVDHQPDLLIQQLENGGVSRFRNNKIDDLREYCIAQDLLDTSTPLTEDEIRIRLQALLSKMTMSWEEVAIFLNRILKLQVNTDDNKSELE